MTHIREPRRLASSPRPARRPDRLGRARALAPVILDIHLDALPRCARRALVSETQLTSTGVAVVVLAPVGGPPCAIIKMPVVSGAARSLERETAALTTLHADDRLGDWRNLIPRPRAQGSLREQTYRVDSALAGHRVHKPVINADPRHSLLDVAAETIERLHRATATTLTGDLDIADLWVDAHLREIERHAPRRRPIEAWLKRLRDELHDALAGRSFAAGWIHGDYWLGNLLFAGPGPTPGPVAGIVDWDAAAPFELPLHDVLHLLLYTRRLRTGQELGQIVRGQLLRGQWSVDERRLLDRHATWRRDRSLDSEGSFSRDGSLSERHAILLYWLRQVAMHARQQSPPVGYRYRLWERRNILPVLTSL